MRAPRTLGPYELVTSIGRGGAAEVYLAVRADDAGPQIVAVKVVHDAADSLAEEGRLTAMIAHPNVVAIHEVGEADGRSYLAMEYLEGESLLSILRAGTEGQRLEPLATARVIHDAAEALEAAHRLKSPDGKPLGLVHHDVSLGNLIVLYTGVTKLLDFGVARSRREGSELVAGKPEYMAPEKLEEGADVDRRSDLWSLGVVAWEALTLTRLFAADTPAEAARLVREAPIEPPSKLDPEIPPELDAIVLRALERDPARRYSTAKAFAMDLGDVLRKRGLGGTEAIARYMQRTFATRIAARARMLDAIRAGQVSPSAIRVFREALGLEGPPARLSDPRLPELPEPAPAAQQVPARRRPLLPIAIGAGAALVLAIAVARCGGGDSGAHALDAAVATGPAVAPDAHARAVALDAELDAAIAAAEPDAGPPEPAEPVEPAEPAEPAVIEPVPERATVRPLDRPPPPRATSPEGLYASGMAAYRRRDYKAAVTAFDAARSLAPNFANAWHGLGLAHEAQGNRGAAKGAYLRYLSLAPRAANAPQVRERLKNM